MSSDIELGRIANWREELAENKHFDLAFFDKIMNSKPEPSGASADANLDPKQFAAKIQDDVDRALKNPDDLQALTALQETAETFGTKNADGSYCKSNEKLAEDVQKELRQLEANGKLPKVVVSGGTNWEGGSIWAKSSLPGQHEEKTIVMSSHSSRERTVVEENSRLLLVESTGRAEMVDHLHGDISKHLVGKSPAGWSRYEE